LCVETLAGADWLSRKIFAHPKKIRSAVDPLEPLEVQCYKRFHMTKEFREVS